MRHHFKVLPWLAQIVWVAACRQAVMDRRDLCYIDYDKLLRCRCETPNEVVIADGLALSVQLASLFLYGPNLPQSPADNSLLPALRGSDYESRSALKSKPLRIIVRNLSHNEGVIAADFALLPDLCTAQQMSFFRAVSEADNDGERVRAKADILPLLAELGAQSPACATVHPDSLPVLRQWTDAMEAALAVPDGEPRISTWGKQSRMDASQQLRPLFRSLDMLLQNALGRKWGDDISRAALQLVYDIATVRLPCILLMHARTSHWFQGCFSL